MQKYVTLRQHGRSLGMTVPVDFARACGLRVGDAALWEIEGDNVTLRFFKVKVERTPALAPEQEEAVDAA
jgi:hypothetical protein